MTGMLSVVIRVHRSKGWQEYAINIQADAYVLDALEAAHQQDPTLLFRHSCHHASCGSCGVRINGRERLACITRVMDVISNMTIRIEPLRNFPVIGDLVVDYGQFMQRLDCVNLPSVRPDVEAQRRCASTILDVDLGNSSVGEHNTHLLAATPNRLENCIECGLCISACPVSAWDAVYQGAAVLAAAASLKEQPDTGSQSDVSELIDQPHGVWRCHAAFECTDVCPAGVDPAKSIMTLRKQLIQSKWKIADPSKEIV